MGRQNRDPHSNYGCGTDIKGGHNFSAVASFNLTLGSSLWDTSHENPAVRITPLDSAHESTRL